MERVCSWFIFWVCFALPLSEFDLLRFFFSIVDLSWLFSAPVIGLFFWSLFVTVLTSYSLLWAFRRSCYSFFLLYIFRSYIVNDKILALSFCSTYGIEGVVKSWGVWNQRKLFVSSFSENLGSSVFVRSLNLGRSNSHLRSSCREGVYLVYTLNWLNASIVFYE